MSHSCVPSRMVRRCDSIFWRALASMRASAFSNSSSRRRISWRMVLGSSMNSTCSISRSPSMMARASTFILSRERRTPLGISASAISEHRLVLAHQLHLHLLEHLLVAGARFAHLFLVGFQDLADIVVDAVFHAKFIGQRGMHTLGDRRHVLAIDELAGDQFFRDFAGKDRKSTRLNSSH